MMNYYVRRLTPEGGWKEDAKKLLEILVDECMPRLSDTYPP